MHLIRRAACRQHFIIPDLRAGGSSYLYSCCIIYSVAILKKMHETYKYVPVRSLIYSLVNGLIL